MNKFNFLTKALALLLIFATLASCHKDELINPTSDTVSGERGHTITGRVVDESNNPISGIVVQCNGHNKTTGSFGEFSFENITIFNNRATVYTNPTNYFAGTVAVTPSSTKITQVQLTLMAKTTTAVLTSSTGGTASLANGSEVTIPSNAVTKDGAAYTGNVNVAVAYLDPTSDNFSTLNQGDMKAQDEKGEEGTLYSYGVLRVELSDDAGNELNLASGKPATIRMPIPSSMTGDAPASIPLWYFDEAKGIWIEEGEAIKVGDDYVGVVSHFTDWNCDVFSRDQATITGKVVDCNDNPVPFIFVKLGQTGVYTNANGEFTRRVPSGFAIACQINDNSYLGLSSNVVTTSVLTPGELYDAGILTTNPCAAVIKGKIEDCIGNNLTGWIKLTYSSDYITYYYCDGDFSIPALTSTGYEILAIASNGETKSLNITTGVNPTNENIANVVVSCTNNPVINENSYVVDGDGHSMESIVFDEISNLFNSFAYNSQQSLNIYISGPIKPATNDSNSIHLSIIDNPIALGNYAFGSNPGATGSVSLGSYFNGNHKTYNAVSGEVRIVILTNDLVAGTFSGTFKDPNSNATINVTNGKFLVLKK